MLESKGIVVGNGQDYAWAKQGMIFPFLEFMDRCVYMCVCVNDFGWLVLTGCKLSSLIQIPGADAIVQEQTE